MLRLFVATAALAFTAGCAGSFEEAAVPHMKLGAARLTVGVDAARCASLDTAHRNWGAAAKGSTVLAGAAGLVTIPVTDKTGRIALVSGATVMAALAAFSVFEAEDAAVSWARECGR